MFPKRNRNNKLRIKRRLKKHNKPQINFFKPLSLNPQVVDLPHDLIFTEILTRLPVDSLTRFKSVSKTWDSIISNPHFIKSHLRCTISNPFVPSNCVFIKSPYFFYILNYGAYDRYPDGNLGEKGLIKVKNLSFSDNGVNTFLIGSCNGLVCFGRSYYSSSLDYRFRVYNPLIGHCYDVLDPLGNFVRKLIYGFGFVSSKDDYRLFVAGLQRRSSENFVYVHSLRSKEWKKIGVFDETEFSVFRGGSGVLVNETLHWDMTQLRLSSVKNNKCICGFDLVDETFKYMPMPKAFVSNANGDRFEFRLCEMGGSLCAWGEDINGGLEMWMLMQYRVSESWMKMFRIDSNSFPRLDNFYGCTESGKVLVQTNEGSLLLVDLDHSPPKYTSIVKDMSNIEIVSYLRSPVSPFL